MSEPVRLAGTGRLGDATVTWTVSEGRRGRRWREVLTRDGDIVHSLLLETDPERRFAHLELSVPGVLLTLHPEGDGTLHGNRVDAAGTGVEHVEGLPFPDGAFVVVDGSPLGTAAVLWAGQGSGTGSTANPLLGALVDRRGRVTIVETAALRTRLLPALAVDRLGIPALDDGATWPLER